MTPLIRLVSLVTLPIALMIALSHLIGAETGPGDGFTAGIIASLGLTLEYLAFGYGEARRRFEWLEFEHVIFAGVAVALATALIPVLAGGAVLGAWSAAVAVPLLGEVELKTGLAFEIGIFLVVVGGTLAAFDALERVIR